MSKQLILLQKSAILYYYRCIFSIYIQITIKRCKPEFQLYGYVKITHTINT